MRKIWKLRVGIVTVVAMVAGTVGFVGGGFAAAASGDVAGTVFDDVNENGSNDGEPGVSGVTVTAYAPDGTVGGTATTAANGTYVIGGLTDGTAYRIEFTNLPTDYVDGPIGPDSTSSVTFAIPEASSVDFGVHIPETCPAPPANALINTYQTVATCSVATDVTLPQDTFGLLDVSNAVPAGQSDVTTTTPMFHLSSWSITNIGNVLGTAIDTTRGDIYAAASSNYSQSFYNNSAGVTETPGQTRYGNLGGGADSLTAAGTLYQMDAVSGAPSVFAQLPQQSTTVTHSECEGNTVESINRTTGVGLGNVVYDRINDQLFVANWEDGHIYRLSMTGSILDAYDIDATDDGSAGLANGKVPFGLEISDAGDRLYFGVLFDREVWSVDLNSGSFTGTPSTNGAGVSVYENSSSETLNSTITMTAGESTPGFLNSNLNFHISDLEILPDGDMLVGIRVGCEGTPHASYNHQGQTHKLEANGAGLFTTDTGALNISATGDAGLDDNYGGVAYLEQPDGSVDYVVTSADILAEAGPHGLAVFNESNAGGAQVNPLGAIDFGTPFDPKGIIGDVEVYNPYDCTPSTVQIGNRVWLDLDGDGIQDPDEAPLENVTVTLFAADGTTVLAATTTDADGVYTFGDADGVGPNTSYVLGFDASTTSTAIPGGFTANDLIDTAVNTGAASNADLTDSDLVGGTIVVTTAGPGSNDHSFDAGFTLPYDLALTKAYTSDTFGNTTDGVIENGEDVTFTITVTNQGFGDATFDVTDYMPAGFVLNDAAWTDNADGTATISAGPLASGASIDIPITLTADTAGSGDLINWAEISADDGNDVDSTPDATQANDNQPGAVGDSTDGVIDNSADAAGDPDEDDHDPAGITVIAYDLALTKAYTSDTFGNTTDGVIENGEDVTFTVTVTNQGTVSSGSFDVTDYMPAGFSLNDAAWTDNNDGTATITAGPLAPGAAIDIPITLTADSSGAGDIVNWAEISSDAGNDPDSTPDATQANDNQPAGVGDPTDGVIDNTADAAGDPDEDDHDPAGVTVDAYDLALTKAYSSDTFDDTTDGVIEDGSDVTFTITLTNQGTVDATNIEVTDYLPTGFDLNDAAWNDNGDGTADRVVTSLLAGATADITITMTANGVADGEFTNWAEISADDGNDADSTPDTTQGNDNQPAGAGDPTDGVIDNTADAAGDPDEDDHDPASVVVGSFDLALTKAYTSDTFANTTDGVVENGSDATFTITVTNQGTLEATAFTVTDYIPAGFVLNDAAWIDNGDGTARTAGGPLAAGASIDIPITLTAATALDGEQENWAEISVDDGNDVDSTPDADEGNDNQPTGPGQPGDDVVDNTGGDEDDHDVAGITVASYDLALTKAFTSDTFGNTTDGLIEDGEDATFTITVTNQGDLDAASFAVTDYLPAGFDLNDAAWTDNADGTATISGGPLAAGASVDITITITANGSGDGDFVNWAEISADDGNDVDSTPDTTQGNDNQPAGVGDPTDGVIDNSADAAGDPDEDDHDLAGLSVVSYDLALTKVYTSDTFGDTTDGVIERGEDVTFTIEVTNQGGVDATNIEVTDYLPPGFVLNDAAWTDNADGTASITIPSLLSGASATRTITMTADSSGAGEITNWAEISADDGNDVDSTPDVTQANDNQPAAAGDPTDGVIDNTADAAGDPDEDDHDPASVTVEAYDLALTKVYTSDTFGNTTDGVIEDGSDVTFTITVTNQGTVNANTFAVTDYLPAGFDLNDAAWTDNADGTATISGGPLAAGASVDITITMTANGVADGDVENWAEISADDGNDADSTPDTTQGNDNQPAAAGDPTDGVIDNTADAAGDPDEDDHDVAGLAVVSYDLALTKSYTSDDFGDPTDGVIVDGSNVTFTITVTNQGTQDAASFAVTDYLPAGFDLSDAAWTDNADGTATISGGPLAAGASVDITITMTANGAAEAELTNWAEISADDGNDVDSTPDAIQANDNQPASVGDPTDGVIDNTADAAGDPDEDDHDPASVTVVRYDLALTKVYASDTFGNTTDGVVENGEDVTFTVTVTNQGAIDAAVFEVTDYLPAGFVLNDAAWTDNADGTATISGGPLAAGASVDIPITLTANGAADGDFVNWAEISADDGNDLDSTPDAIQANDNQPGAVGDPTDGVIDNSADAAGDPDEDDHDPAGISVSSFDLALTKVYASDTFGNTTDGVVENGSDATFTITVTNQGTQNAAFFEVTDYLPAGFVLNDAAWTDNADGTASMSGGPLAAGASVDISITMTASTSGAGATINWAEISSDSGSDVDSTPDAIQANDNQPGAAGDPTDGVIDNTADAAGDPDEDDHDPAGLFVVSYDLALTKAYTSDTFGNTTDGIIENGTDVTFTVTVTNQGTVDANTFGIVDYLPAGFVLSDAAWTDNADGTASISGGPLAAGASVDIPITMTAVSASIGDSINWAEISADDGNDPDSTPDTTQGNDNQPRAVGDPTDGVIDNTADAAGDPDEDDHDLAGVSIVEYDLALTKTYRSDTFGSTVDGVIQNTASVEFIITVTNQGTQDATTFTVTDYLPAGFVLNDAAWTDNADGTASISGGPLAAGASVDIPIVITAVSAAPGDSVNWAEISADDGNDVDSVTDDTQGNDNQPGAPGDPTDDVIDSSADAAGDPDEDDHDPAGVLVDNYDLALTKVYTSDTFGLSTDGVVENGENVTFTITVFNQGTIDATNYTVVDYIPAGFVLNDASWVDNGDGTATFTGGALAPGTSRDISITLTATTAVDGESVNWAEIATDAGFDADSTPDTTQGNDTQPAAVGDPTDGVIDNTAGDEDDHDPAAVQVASFDLALTKVYTSDTFGNTTDAVIQNGSDLTFTIAVLNQGTVDASAFTVVDYIPVGFVLNDAAWTDNGDGTATFVGGGLPAGDSTDITITMTADSASEGPIVNRAEIASDSGNDIDSTPDTNEANDNQPRNVGDPTDNATDNSTDGAGNADEDDHDLAGATVVEYDLALTKVYTSDTSGNATDGSVEVGGDVTFTISVINQGTIEATSVTILDSVPRGFTLNDAAWTDDGGNAASRVVGPIAPGASIDVPITLAVTSADVGNTVNIAEISLDDGDDVDSTPDPDPSNDPQPAAVGDPTDDEINNADGDEDDHDIAGVVVDRYDLALITTYTSDTFGDTTDAVIEPNTDVVFTIDVSNQGTLDAATYDITAYIPTGFALNDAAWTDNGDGTATLIQGALAAGASDSVDITVRSGAVTPGSYVLWAEISADDGDDADSTPDATLANDNQPSSPGDPTDNVVDNQLDAAGDPDEDDHDPAGVGVENFDLALIKALSDDGYGDPLDGVTEDGSDVVFTITVINQGTIDATTFDVTDALPGVLTLNDAAWTDNGDGTATFTGGPLAAGDSVDITLNTVLSGAVDGDYVNLAEISAQDGNDIDSTPDDNFTNDNQPGAPGDPTDNATDNSVDGTGAPDEDDHDIAGFTVASYDLALRKVFTSDTSGDGNAADARLEPGDDAVFTITVTNQGTLDATAFEVTDYVPAGFVLNDAAWTDNGNGTATISGGPLAAGASVDITITMTATTITPGDVVNRAEISSDDGNDVDSTPDGNQGNDNQPVAPGDPTDDVVDNTDGDEDDHDIAGLTVDVYDLEIEKSYLSDSSVDGNSTDGLIQIGDDATFEIEVFNVGTLDATTVEVTDFLPAGFVLNDAAWSDNGDGSATRSVGPIAAGTSTTVTITATSATSGAGDLINVAEITLDDGDDVDSTPNDDPNDDPPNEDDRDEAPLTVDAYDLALRKVYTSDNSIDGNATDGVIEVGDDVTFTITVFNQGTADATDIEVTDYIPAGFVLRDAAWTDNGDGTALRTIPTVLAGDSVDVTITLNAATANIGDQLNAAEISNDDGNDVDSTPNTDVADDGPITDDEVDNTNNDEDDHDPAPFRVAARFDLALSKTLDVATSLPVVTGQEVTFLIAVTNEGSTLANDIVITDYVDLSMWDAFDISINPAGTTTGDQPFPYSWATAGSNGEATLVGTLAPGETVVLPVTLTVASNTTASQLVNAAEISEATPRNPDGSVPPTVEDEDSTPDDTDTDPEDEDDHDVAVVAPPTFSLGNQVWFDANNNGVVDGGETGIADVPVHLFADADGNGAADDTNNDGVITADDAINTMTTDAQGLYLFTELDAGEYVVGIPPNAWDVDAALYGLLSSDPTETDTNTDIDNDDNGFPCDCTDGYVFSGSTLLGDIEPTAETPDNDAATADISSNLTVDFGFWEPRFDLALRKERVGASTVDIGDSVTFTITVFNQGDIAARDIGLIDYLPIGLELDDDDWVSGDAGATTSVAGPLAPGESLSTDITVTVGREALRTTQNLAEITEALPTAVNGLTLVMPNGEPLPDIDSVADASNIESPVDDEIDNAGNDEDDHDIAEIAVRAQTSTSPPLALTGRTVGGLVYVGLLALIAGAVLLLGSRRRLAEES